MKSNRNSLSLVLVVLTYLGFVSIGLPDGLIGVAWPSMRNSFGLPIDSLGSLLVMFTTGYLISSFSSGRLLARISVGTLLALSCLATGVSLLGYALAGRWAMVVALGMLAGLGAGAIDAGLNTYAATHFSARMVNLLHAFYGFGAVGGPLLMTNVLVQGLPWQWGYAVVGFGQLVLAVCFGLSQGRWDNGTRGEELQPETVIRASSFATLRLPVVWFSTATFFIYCGIEATAGAWAYSLFTEARAIPTMTAGTWVSLYWGALTVGRILSAMIAGRIAVRLLLRCCIAGQAIGAAILWFNYCPLSSFLGLALIGLSSAPIFPSLIATTPERIGRNHTGNAVGFQIAAGVLGLSLLPTLAGMLARWFGLEIVAPALLLSAVLLWALHEALTAAGARAFRETEFGVPPSGGFWL